MTIYEQLKLIYICLRKTKDHNREIFRAGDYKWLLGQKIAEEAGMTEQREFFTPFIHDPTEKPFLFGIEVEIDKENPENIKIYEDITNKVTTKFHYKKPGVIEYKGCRNCRYSPGPLQMCDWMKEQTTLYLKCPRWEPKEEQEGSAAKEQEET